MRKNLYPNQPESKTKKHEKAGVAKIYQGTRVIALAVHQCNPSCLLQKSLLPQTIGVSLRDLVCLSVNVYYL